MKTILISLLLSALVAGATTLSPANVAIVFNSNMAQSEELAQFYAKARGIPESNLIGLPLSEQGHISREEFNLTLRDPLRAHFSLHNWWTLGRTPQGMIMPASRKISTLVCMRGVPFKITRQSTPPQQPTNDSKLPAHLSSINEAAVDSELTLLGIHDAPLAGPLTNLYYKKDQSFAEANIAQMMLVGRIDGPDFNICKRMINDAITTESHGLWGMCYLDFARKGGGYAAGDQWLENIAQTNSPLGIPTVTDRNKQTYTTNYPMDDAALYYGWYTKHRNGPLLNEQFQFRQGAVAVHLHSFSASKLRDPNSHWSGPILAKGAAATLGNVYEPYLHLTHHFDIFHDRLIKGYCLVEAAYMASPGLSWQNVVIGDPLYRPFLHLDGSGEKAPHDLDYRAIRVANERWGKEPETLVRMLRSVAAGKENGKLYEYLGLWHRARKEDQIAIAFFDSASKTHFKPSDRLRQWLYVADIHRASGNKRKAIQILRQVQELVGDIPESKTTAALLNILDPPPPPPVQPPAPAQPQATEDKDAKNRS